MTKYQFLIDTVKGRFAKKETSQERMSICASCPLYDNGLCSSKKTDSAVKTFDYKEEIRYIGLPYTGCGCILNWKTRLINEVCPLGKWDAENLINEDAKN